MIVTVGRDISAERSRRRAPQLQHDSCREFRLLLNSSRCIKPPWMMLCLLLSPAYSFAAGTFCSQAGVDCNSGISPPQLYLEDTFISGTLPNGFGEFSDLTELRLARNSLSGTIPASLFFLTKLVVVSLHSNFLSGTLPIQVGHASSLNVLDFSQNLISGTVASTYGNLSGLQYLFLESNFLQGTLPTQIWSMSSLMSIWLAQNRLSGTVPGVLALLTELEVLSAYGLSLSGTLPTEVGLLSSLTVFDVLQNFFSGTVPTQCAQLSGLQLMHIRSNSFHGTMPSQIGELPKLNSLWFNDNLFSGSIPSQFGALSLLTRLELQTNFISGPIPSQVGQLNELVILVLSENQLAGVIPTQISFLTSLQEMSLDNNDLSGSIPPQIAELTLLTKLQFQGNSFTGLIPTQLGRLVNTTTCSFAPNDGDFLCPPLGADFGVGKCSESLRNLPCVAAGLFPPSALPPSLGPTPRPPLPSPSLIAPNASSSPSPLILDPPSSAPPNSAPAPPRLLLQSPPAFPASIPLGPPPLLLNDSSSSSGFRRIVKILLPVLAAVMFAICGYCCYVRLRSHRRGSESAGTAMPPATPRTHLAQVSARTPFERTVSQTAASAPWLQAYEQVKRILCEDGSTVNLRRCQVVVVSPVTSDRTNPGKATLTNLFAGKSVNPTEATDKRHENSPRKVLSEHIVDLPLLHSAHAGKEWLREKQQTPQQNLVHVLTVEAKRRSDAAPNATNLGSSPAIVITSADVDNAEQPKPRSGFADDTCSGAAPAAEPRPTLPASPVRRLQVTEEEVRAAYQDVDAETMQLLVRDWGTESIYNSLHPVLFSPKGTIFVLVFDLCALADVAAPHTEPAASSSTSQTQARFNREYARELEEQLYQIKAFASDSPLILVGTRADDYATKHGKDFSVLSEQLKCYLQYSPAFERHIVVPTQRNRRTRQVHGAGPVRQDDGVGTVQQAHEDGSLCFLPVNSSCLHADEAFGDLLVAIRTAAEKLPAVQLAMPLSWLHVKRELEGKRETTSYVPLREVRSIADLCQVADRSEQEAMLEHFHSLGVVFWVSSLRAELVILDVNWLLGRLVDLIRTAGARYRPTHGDDNEWKKFTPKVEQWRRDLPSEAESTLRSVGEHFGLMVSVPGAQELLVPALLASATAMPPANPSRPVCLMHMSRLEHRTGRDVVLVLIDELGHGFLPRAAFHQILAVAVDECCYTTTRSVSKPRISEDYCKVSFGNATLHLTLEKERPSAIRVDIENEQKRVEVIDRLRLRVRKRLEQFAHFSDFDVHFLVFMPELDCYVDLDKLMALTTAEAKDKHVNMTELTVQNVKDELEKKGWLRQQQRSPGSYDIMISYRWPAENFEELDSLKDDEKHNDAEVADMLYECLSVCNTDGEDGKRRRLQVFMDKPCLEVGKPLDDFLDAVEQASVLCPIVSWNALMKMTKLEANSPVDNVLLEWSLALLLQKKGDARFIVPIFRWPREVTSEGVRTERKVNFFSARRPKLRDKLDGYLLNDGKVPVWDERVLIDRVPDVKVSSVIARLDKFFSENPTLGAVSEHRTVRDVVLDIIGSFGVELSDDPTFWRVMQIKVLNSFEKSRAAAREDSRT